VILWLLHPVSISSSSAYSSFLTVSSLLSVTRTLVIGFRVHAGNLGLFHFEIFNLMTSKTFFKMKSYLWDLSRCIFWSSTIQLAATDKQ
jgi:hypothetical protein